MSETPSSKPRHALSDTGPSVPAQGGPRDDLFGAGAEGAARPSVPRQHASPADDRVEGTGAVPFDEAPTQALPVIPRPRHDGDGSGHPPVATVARLPEPFRPAPVHGVPARSSAGRGFGLPELPSSVRPVLPAVLGAAAALILALGVVAGVNGAPDPAPAPPAPVSNR